MMERRIKMQRNSYYDDPKKSTIRGIPEWEIDEIRADRKYDEEKDERATQRAEDREDE